ncbi:hypothetical protein JCM8097_001579 [Rhodosporidiobolus ruineniae]
MRFHLVLALACLFAVLLTLVGASSPSTAHHGLEKRRLDKRSARTSTPSGAVVVAQDGSGKYSTISAAVKAGATSIFVKSGTYKEQVSVTKDGVTIYGPTDTSTYAANTVTITYGLSADTAGDDDSSGTLRVHANKFSLYNVNAVNSYGKGSQALALSAYGTEQGFYGCSFKGYQDTILTDTGTQVFSQCYVEGATDFIFGQTANSWFDHSTLAIVGAGYIVAPGRESASDSGLYVFNSCTIKQADSVSTSLKGQAYLGRPWRNYARAVYKYCSISDAINSAGWHVWSTSTANTEHILFGEYQNSGAGAWSSSRASFATQLSSTDNAKYSISAVLGSDYKSWVDASYVA